MEKTKRKDMRKSIKNNEKGITLVALVVTIVVLLILAGISLNLVLGNNGIINKAKDAKDKSIVGKEKETISLAYSAAYTKRLGENITRKDLQDELDTSETKIKVSDGGDGTFEILFKDTEHQYVIDKGNVSTSKPIDWDQILEEANSNPEEYKHKEQLSSEYIAIGTNGKPVNMDLWKPTKLEDGTWGLDYNVSIGYWSDVYRGKIIDGQIQGKVPQYIYNSDVGEFKEVVSMYHTFGKNKELEQAPEIPETVTNMGATFAFCEKLTQAPEIPNAVIDMTETFVMCRSLKQATIISDSVTSMDYIFHGCDSLEQVTIISDSITNLEKVFEGVWMGGIYFPYNSLKQVTIEANSVTNMQELFSGYYLEQATIVANSATNMQELFAGCGYLKQATVISDNVTNMYATFAECGSLEQVTLKVKNVTNMDNTFADCSLTQAPEIPNTVTSMNATFVGCDFVQAPVIPKNVTNMDLTFLGCTNLTQAPVIPENVTSMQRTFNNCKSLTGEFVINANPTKYTDCLNGASTNDDANLVVSGDSTMLQQIVDTKSPESHISLK